MKNEFTSFSQGSEILVQFLRGSSLSNHFLVEKFKKQFRLISDVLTAKVKSFKDESYIAQRIVIMTV